MVLSNLKIKGIINYLIFKYILFYFILFLLKNSKLKIIFIKNIFFLTYINRDAEDAIREVNGKVKLKGNKMVVGKYYI